jgi:radical SAM protein with 4Fe4S-binding SPASM domain
MKYFLSHECALKWLETKFVYNIKNDDLYELDDKSFRFLMECSLPNGFQAKNSKFLSYCKKEGLLTTNNIAFKQPPLIKSPSPSLRYLELQITDKCNLRCKHCYIEKKNSHELSIKQIRNILKEFEAIQGLRVLITGGEPLLHRKFDEINKILPQFQLRKVLFTNGTLLNKKILKHLNAHEIQVSIDGLEKSHDSLRGKGTFKKSIDSVKLSLEKGFDVSISTMVHAKNLNDFDKMEKLFKKLGIKEWTVDIPCITGNFKKHTEFQVPPETGGKYLRYGYGGGIHTASASSSKKNKFACGRHLMSVMADGKAAKCSFYSDKPLGKIQDGLRACWQKLKHIKLSELDCDCKYLEICRGGCRYRAAIFGNNKSKDLYRCALYSLL